MVDVIIKVPEKVWNTIERNGEVEWCGIEMADAVRNGTPLPKGHGRLGDLSKIYIELNKAQIEGTEEYKGLGDAKQNNM